MRLDSLKDAEWRVPRSETKLISDWDPRKVEQMKKLMFAASAALCAAIGFSEETVQSPEIVGYTSRDVAANTWTLVAAQFQDVKGTSISIQDVLDKDALTASWMQAYSSQIQIAKPAGGFNQYWLIDEVDNPDYDDGLPVSEDNPDIYENVWVLLGHDWEGPVDVTIPVCTGFWMKNPTATSVYFNK